MGQQCADMEKKIYQETEKNMEKILEASSKTLSNLRAGRASISLVEGIKVDCYGSQLPLNQVATISTPSPQLLLIIPWDKTLIEKVKTSLLESNLGMNPVADKNQIKVPVPSLSEERRREITKIAKKLGEEAKIAFREERHQANDSLKKLEKEKKISEDTLHRGLKEIQELTDGYIKKVEAIVEKKEKEILEG